MAAGFVIADGYVQVTPDTSNFAARLRAELARVDAAVRVDPDTSGFAAELRARLAGLRDVRVKVTPDLAAFTGLRARLLGIGPIDVKVTPDVTGFTAALRARLAALRDVRVRVGVEVDTAGLRVRIAEAVQRAARGLAARVAVDLRTTQLRADIVAAIAAAARGLEIVIPVRADSRGLRGEVSRAALAAGLRQQVTVPLNLDPSSMRTGMIAIAAAVAAGAAPLAAPIVAAVEQAVTASVGALGVLPAAAAGAAQAFGVLKLATAGMGDALKASAEGGEKYAEALAKLPPPARAFTEQLVALRPWLDRLKLASGGVFPGLGDALRGLTSTLPVVEAGLGRTAAGISRVGTAAGTWFGSPVFSRELAGVMTANAVSTENLGFAGLSLARGMWDVVAVGAPIVQALSESARTGAQAAASWLAAKRESGALSEWITRGIAQVRQFGVILLNFGIGVNHVFRAIASGAGDAMGGVERFSDAFLRFTGSEAFQTRVGGAFAEVRRLAGVGAAGVRSALADIAAGFNQGGTAAGAVGLAALFQAVGAKARAFVDVIRTDGIPAFQKLWPVISTQVMPALARLSAAASDLVTAGLGSLFELVGTYGPIALGLLVAALHVLVPPLAAVAGWLKDNQTIIGALLTAIAVIAAPILAVVGAIRVAVAVFTVWNRVIGLVRLAWMALSIAWSISPLGVILLALAALVAALIFAWKNSEQFRQIVTAVWNAIKEAFSTAINFVINFVRQWWPYLIGLLTGGIGLAVVWVIRHWDSIKNAFSAAITWGINFVRQWWPVLLAPITGGLSLVVGFVIRHWDSIKNAFSAALNFVKDRIVLPVMRAVEHGIDASLGAISRFFSNAVEGIKRIWHGLQEVAAAPVRFIVNTVFNSGIRRAWNAIVAKIPGVPEMGELRVPGLAAGGPVAGPGPRGRDSVLRLLAPGEHVWTDREVENAGGHSAVFALRRRFGGGGQSAGPGMLLGGIGGFLADAWNATGGRAVDKLEDLAREGFARGFELALGPLRAGVNAVLGRGDDWRGTLGRLIQSPLDRLLDWVRGKETEGGMLAGRAGAGVERWRTVAMLALAQAGQPLSWIGLLLRRMNQESGGNPTVVNKSDCLTLEHMILTRRGWLSHDQVRAGDETIGYNPETGRSEWTAILRVVHFDDAEVWRVGNGSWHADVTPNHRWWSDTLTRVQPTFDTCDVCGWAPRGKKAPSRGVQVHRMKIHGLANPDGPPRTLRGEFVRTDELRSGHRLRLAAPADTAGIPGLSLEDVRVIAWIQGDGCIRGGSRPTYGSLPASCWLCPWPEGYRQRPEKRITREVLSHPGRSIPSLVLHLGKIHGVKWDAPDGERAETVYDATIYQSKPAMVVKLRALLARVDHREHVRERGGNTRPAHEFRLRREYVTDLWKRAGIAETGPEAFVLALSPDQRAAWLDAMIDAEGHRMPGKKPGWSEFVRIAQVDGPLQDAVKLAVYLEGWRPTYSANSAERNGHQPAGVVGMAGPHVAPSMFHEPQVLERQPVWCVTTDLGTLTARGGDALPFLTGNSNWKAGTPSVGLLTDAGNRPYV